MGSGDVDEDGWRMSNFNSLLEFAMFECQGSSGYSLDKNRPYDGQPHTADGIRGKEIIRGLTMRDISDCIVLGMLDCGKKEISKNPVCDDIYNLNFDDIDPGAVIKNALCHVEKKMGVFPNVPPLEDAPHE